MFYTGSVVFYMFINHINELSLIHKLYIRNRWAVTVKSVLVVAKKGIYALSG